MRALEMTQTYERKPYIVNEFLFKFVTINKLCHTDFLLKTIQN